MMGREYVIQSWVKHEASDPRIIPDDMIDHAPGYSGEQVGNRLARSHGNTRTRSDRPGWLANGNADIASAADDSDNAKNNPLYAIDPAFRVMDEYPVKLAALDAALESGALPWSAYSAAKAVLDGKLIQAERKLAKIAAITQEEDQEEEDDQAVECIAFDHFLPVFEASPEEKKEAEKSYLYFDDLA